NAKKRIIKPKWMSGQPNQLSLNILLSEIVADKRKKEWVTEIKTRIEKCSGCKYNRGTVKENCITRIKFDEGWKVILKNIISKTELSMQIQANLNLASLAQEMYCKDPTENEHELKELHSLKSPERELIIQAKLNKELKEEMLATLTRNLN
ncbi:39126_t:CDS:2, partial [Gigaspora margarita]